MTLLDVSIVNVALPSLRSGLGVSPSGLSWVVAGYTLAFGLALIPAGRLGDGFGRRRLFLIGLAGFTAASAACGFAGSSASLLAARLVQGLAGGVLTPQVVGLMQQLFRGRERGTASGVYAAMIAAATAIGPVLGGLLIQAAGNPGGWRWVFFVNLPLGAVALVLGSRLLPRDRPRGPAPRVDLAGVVLLGGGIAAIILPLGDAGRQGGSGRWYLLAAGAALLAAFVAWERRHPRPLVDLGLFRRRSYTFGALVALPYFAGYSGIPFVVSLYFQQGLGWSAAAAGAAGIPFAAGSAITAALSGRAVHRFGRLLVLAGTAAAGAGIAGAAAAVQEGGSHRWLFVLGPLLLAGAGSGAVIGPNLTLALRSVPLSEGSTAGAVLQTGQRLGSAIGLAVTGALFFGTVASGGDFARATRESLDGSAVFVALALLVSAADLAGARRRSVAGKGNRPQEAG
ncbi:MFS transporter [Amycolatopsis rhizosphaerae]|uniref:MFS transporter n=2 Tax=Amycolatopsis rhizosphaerae TaxID=2053003 RepID=A0A558B907_9PSEU|nr:MFS transporter [Amycolatopsis rhizosphaerae]